MTPSQSKSARNLLGWNQADLAERGRVSKRTVAEFESGGDTRVSSVALMQMAFDKAGIIFIDDASKIGVLLAKKMRYAEKKAASKKGQKIKRL